MQRYSLIIASVALVLVLLSAVWTKRSMDLANEARENREQPAPQEVLPATPDPAPIPAPAPEPAWTPM